MKDLKTIPENQLLHYARQELSRRINSLKTDIVKGTTSQSVKRTESLLKMLTEQLAEINERLAEINREEY